MSLAPILKDLDDQEQEQEQELEPKPSKPVGRASKRQSTLNTVTSLKAIQEEPGLSSGGSGSSLEGASKRSASHIGLRVATPEKESLRQLRCRTIIPLGETEDFTFHSPLAPP